MKKDLSKMIQMKIMEIDNFISKWKTLIIIVLCIIIFLSGFIVGRSHKYKPGKTSYKIEYIKGEMHTDTIEGPVPSAEIIEIPVPYAVHDTTIREVDTAAILADYFIRREYPLDFSNDSIGTFKVDVTVKQNKITRAVSTIQPFYKKVTVTNEVERIPLMQFYGIVGSSHDFTTNKIQLGIDIKQKVMLGVSGMRINDAYGYTIDLGIKF